MTISIDKNIDIPMQDGVVLRGDLYRPAVGGPFPTLIQRTPYNKELLALTGLTLDPIRAAARGFAVLIQDVRARWASDGDVFFMYRDEFADGGDTARWAAQQSWCNGRIGGYGLSYMGGTSWLMAAAAPDDVSAIATATAPHDFWRNHLWRGGALNLGLLISWSLAAIGPAACIRNIKARGLATTLFDDLVDAIDAFDGWARHTPIETLPPARAEDAGFIPFLFEILKHPAPDAFTDSLLMTEHHGKVAAPALMIAGWHDLLLEADLENWAAAQARAEETGAQHRLVIGPWSHGAFQNVVGEMDYGFRASGMLIDGREDLTNLQLRWFDRHLVGAGDGLDEDPPVKIFLQGANVWRSETAWPPPGARTLTLNLTAAGALTEDKSAPGAQTYTFDPNHPTPTRGGPILLPAKYVRGPVDQSPLLRRADVLQFATPPLGADLNIMGEISVVLFAATSGRDTDWVVKLCDVHPEGAVYNVTDGVLRARYRDGFDNPALLEPGTRHQYKIQLAPTAMRFKRGHRIMLLVTSSDFPRYDRNPNTGESPTGATQFEPARQTIFCGGENASHISLSVV